MLEAELLVLFNSQLVHGMNINNQGKNIDFGSALLKNCKQLNIAHHSESFL